MNIYLHELKMKIKSIIIWSFSLGLLMLVYMSVFPAFAEQADVMNDMLASFPEEFLMAFGMAGVDLSTIVGYFGIIMLFCQLIVSIQAANYGFSLVSVEERDLTADFLLAKPISRFKILTAKLLAALTALAITNIVIWVSTFVLIGIFEPGKGYDQNMLMMLLGTVAFMQLFFLSVGMVISQLVRRIRTVVPFSMGLVFALYVLSAFGGMLGDDSFSIITPFKHFEPNGIIGRSGYDTGMTMISVVIIVVSVAATYFLYNRRNIHSI